MKNNVHLGHVIKQLIERSDGSINTGAERLGYSVQGMYAIFEKEDVSTSLLKKLCVAYDVPLTYFFNSYLWADNKSRFTEEEGVKYVASRIEDDVRLTLLESENKNLKEQNELLKEMLDMYRTRGKRGTNSGTKL